MFMTTLDLTFAALADPTRRAILVRLMQGEASVNELTARSRLSQPTVSKHVQVLERAGLVKRRKAAQFRPCKLDAKRLLEAWSWLGGYQRFWEESLDRLDAFAKTLHAKEQKYARNKRR
jgi:DNA-binding transcriptional ArsR family regulator